MFKHLDLQAELYKNLVHKSYIKVQTHGSESQHLIYWWIALHMKEIITKSIVISYTRILNASHPDYEWVYLLEQDNSKSHGFVSPYLKQVTELLRWEGFMGGFLKCYWLGGQHLRFLCYDSNIWTWGREVECWLSHWHRNWFSLAVPHLQ